MSDKRWTHQTAGKIADCLAQRLDIQLSASVVRRLLKNLGYSLKANKKCLSAGNSPYRDAQFGIIKGLRQAFLQTGDPIISVDSKKKELIGRFKNPGRLWCEKPIEVKDHDFRSEAIGLAVPYGVYDLSNNSGMLIVGQSADTPEFAANSIATWWQEQGRDQYPNSKRLLILADSGGSNGIRPRAWKKFLHEKLANQHGLTITVAHYPPGTSKWNPIEHRMFSEISKNWAGFPLESFDAVVNLARHTRTTTGFRVEASHDQRIYEKGIKVSDREMKEIAVTKADSLGNWNYTISPAATASTALPISQAQEIVQLAAA